MITLTTRGDCVGVCVDDEVELVGGIGGKKSNGGTQYYSENRIYNGDKVASAICTANSLAPFYTVDEDEQSTETNTDTEQEEDS